MNLFPDSVNQSLMLEKKGLNISLSFKFSLWISNYFKSMKLNLVFPNQALTKQQNISSKAWDPRI